MKPTIEEYRAKCREVSDFRAKVATAKREAQATYKALSQEDQGTVFRTPGFPIFWDV